MDEDKQLVMFPAPPLTDAERIDAQIAQARAEYYAREATKPSAMTREQMRSRRKRQVRATTVSVKRMTRAELDRGRVAFPEGDDIPERPLTRAECTGVPRPCPFVSCRHHLYLDVSARTGAIKLNFPDMEVDELPANASCALDVADRDGTTLEGIGEIMNLTRERVRQVEVKALSRLQAAHDMYVLRDAHGEAPGKRRLPIVTNEDDDAF